MRRVAVFAAFWAVMFTVVTAVGLILPGDEGFGRAAVRGAAYATFWPLGMALANRLRARRRPPDAVFDNVTWRVRRGGPVARRWQPGWLCADGTALVPAPVAGSRGPRLDAGSVRPVRERELNWRERLWVGRTGRVLEVDLPDGGLDLIVQECDVEDVRRRLLGAA